MEPNAARAEADRWLGISAKLLNGRDLVGCKSFAIRARDADPSNPVADQILAVVDTLTASEKRVINSSTHDWYSILQLPHLLRHPDLVTSHYARLLALLNPDHNPLPFADLALQLVNDAYSVLSDPSKKWNYDSQLSLFLHRSDDFVDQTPTTTTSDAASTFQFFQHPDQAPLQWLHQQQQQQQQQLQQQPQLQERQLLQQHHNGQIQQQIPHKVQPHEAFNSSTFQLFQQPPPQQQQQQWLYHPQPQLQLSVPQQWPTTQPIEQRVPDQPQRQQQETMPVVEQLIPPQQRATVHVEQPIPPQQRDTLHVEQEIPPQPQQEPVRNVGEEVNGRGNVDAGYDGNEEEGIESFWTTCPYCYYTYEYPKRYLDCTLRCQHCRRAFQALENLNPPPPITGDGKEETTFECWGCFPLGFSMEVWKKSNPFAGGERGLGSVYMPFTPMVALPRSPPSPQAVKRDHLRGPVVYIDDDDVDFNAPYTSEDSDTSDDWYSAVATATPSKKMKSARGRMGRVGRKSKAEKERIRLMNQNGVVDDAVQQKDAALGEAGEKNEVTNNGGSSVRKQTNIVTRGRAVTRSTAEKERLKMLNQNSDGVANGADIPHSQGMDAVQQGNISPRANNCVINKAGVSGSVRKQMGRGRGRKKLDLNVEFRNEVEEHAPTVSAGNGEEEVGFFEGLDEFLSTLPLLHPVGDDKAKPS